MKIIALDAFALNPGDISWNGIEALGDFTSYDRTIDKDIITRSVDADVLIVNKVKLTRSVLSELPNLKFVLISATGFDNVDIEACRSFGISLSNVMGYSTESVVQHVFAMLLSHLNKVNTYATDTAQGRWSDCKDFTFFDHPIMPISGKKVGVIGLGNIGRKVAKVFDSFGAEVYSLSSSSYKVDHISYISLETLLSTVDVLTLHIPLNGETQHIINKDSLRHMKSDAILINTARGGHIQEKDLANHLKKTPTFTALLDVLSQEPPSASNPLLNLDNCMITPHQAWAGFQSRVHLMNLLAKAIIQYKDDQQGNLV